MNEDNIIIDTGLPTFFTTVPIVRNKNHVDLILPHLPKIPLPLPAYESDDKKVQSTLVNLIEQKIELCSNMCDFSDNEADLMAKIEKTDALNELEEVFVDPKALEVLPEVLVQKYLEMLLKNIMRDMPSISERFLAYDDAPGLSEVNWPHLSIVYNQLLGFQKLFPQLIDKNYAILLIKRLHAPDIKEREQVLNFFVCYVKAFPQEKFDIMNRFSYILYGYLEKKFYPFAIVPILKFYIKQFPSLTKEMDKLTQIFLSSCLPLLRGRHFLSYHSLLIQLINFFISNDKSLASTVLQTVIKYWPQSIPHKQIIFLSLINYLLEQLSANSFKLASKDVFNLFAECAYSSHSKVVEASFNIWANVKILPKILINKTTIFPIIFPALLYVSKEHWSVNVQTAAANAIKSIHDMEPFINDVLVQSKLKNVSPKEENSRDLVAHKTWAFIARAAARADKTVNLGKTLAIIQMRFNKPNCENTTKFDAPRKISKTKSLS